MFCERFANPAIFAFVCSKQNDEVVPSSIVGVEEVRDYSKKTKSAGKYNELIFGAKLTEDVLLVLLRSVSSIIL